MIHHLDPASLDFTVNFERLATAFEKIAAELFERNRIERERLVLEFPVKREPRSIEVTNPHEERRELYSDKPSKEWSEQTEAALPENKSRFQERLDATRQPQGGKSPVGSPAKVPKTQ